MEHWNWYAVYVLLPFRMDCLAFGVLAALVVRNPRALAIARRQRLMLDFVAVAAFVVGTWQQGLNARLTCSGLALPS